MAATPAEKKAVKEILGADTYEKPDNSGTARATLYGGTEGEDAETDLQLGDRPYTIRSRYRGARTKDIDLPAEKPAKRSPKRATAKRSSARR